MKVFFAFIIFFLIPQAFAQTICFDSIALPGVLESMSTSAEVMKCFATREQYQCSKIEEELIASEKNKVIRCDLKSLSENTISNMSFGDCVWNGLKISGQQLVDLASLPGKIAGGIAKGFNETQLCNQNLEKKREILTAFNLTIEDERFTLSEKFLGKWLEEAPCSEIEKLLSSRYQNYQNTMMKERMNSINGSRKSELREVKGEKANPGLLGLMKVAFAEAKTKYECYTPKVKAEMVCAAVTSILADAALGGGVMMAAKKISAVVKSKKALSAIENASASGSKIDLEDSAKLLAGDRKKAASIVLDNKVLTQAQKEAIISAHNVGLKEGRGYYTYTDKDLLKKSKILKEAGFDRAERDILMKKSGITGKFSVDEAGEVFTAEIQKKMKYDNPQARNAILKQFNKYLDDYKTTSDPEIKANYARLLGEMSGSVDAKTARAFYQLGFEKVKSLPESTPGFFSRSRTLENYLDLAARSGDQNAVKKGISEFIKKDFADNAKRNGWRSAPEAAEAMFVRLETEAAHQSQQSSGNAAIFLESARRKQKALLEEFKYLDQNGTRMKAIEADIARLTNE